MRSPRWEFTCGALFLLMMVQTGSADDKAGEGRRTIVVTGQGEVTAAPDLVIVAVAVETTADKATEAVGQNAARSAKVAAALKALIKKDDTLTTTRYSLEPRYEQTKPGQPVEPRIIGYIARNEVQVETHQIDSVGALLDGAISAGANRVST